MAKLELRNALVTEIGAVREKNPVGSSSFAGLEFKAALWCLLAICAAVWFYTLSARTLVPSDEARYAEIASEMAMTGDFITLRLNGIKYFGKPPLQAWMNALTFRLFGLGEWQARLWTGMCGIFGILVVFHAGRRVYNRRTGYTAALVLGSSIYWIVAGHVNSYDMSLSAMMALALGALLIAQRAQATQRQQRKWMLICWAGMALAVLSKGMVGIVLPGAVLVLYTLVSRDWQIWKRLHVVNGLLIFLGITAPWFIMASIQNPEFPYFFFVREHFHRFTSNVHLRAKPWHYFIPLVVLGVMPWLGVVGQSLRNGARRSASGFQAGRLLLTWVVFIFFFFSFSKAKLPSYILPIFPALALLIAHYLDSASHKALLVAAYSFGLPAAAFLGFLVTAPLWKLGAGYLLAYQSYIPWLAGAASLAAAGSGLAALLAHRHREWGLVALAASSFLAGQVLMLGHEPIGRDKAGIAHLQAIQSAITPQTPIYAVGAYEYAMPFYLRRTMTLVGKAEDGMQLGLQQEPHLWMPELDAFVEKWKEQHESGVKAVAVMRPDIFSGLRRQGVPMRVIARDQRRVVVTNEAVEAE